jgi:YD repeat-containing protein
MKKKYDFHKTSLVIIITFALINVIPSFADTINYTYDDLNRIVRIENLTNGNITEFQYDAVGNRTQKTITNRGIRLQVTVRKDSMNALPAINTYLFSEGGRYLGMAKETDTAGAAVFDIPQGAYKIRADYMGYQFWTGTVQANTDTSINLTIPHHTVIITVNCTYQGIDTPHAGIRVYLFTPSNTYLGLSQLTTSDGRVRFSLPDKDYKVRSDYMGRQYFSSVFNAQDTVIRIPMAEAEIAVTQGGHTLRGVKVYVFTPGALYLGMMGVTNNAGKTTFRLPAASYKFRVDYLGNKYWSSEEALSADQLKPITINTGGGLFTLIVLKDSSNPLSGAGCRLFNEGGSYLGIVRPTDTNGRAFFNLSNGSYKFRVDYLGYHVWTDIVTVPTTMSLTKTIAHKTVTITVTGSLANNIQLKPGVPVHLFSPSGSYLSISGKTDGNGRATFNLPQQPFKVRIDYLSQRFWSDIFIWEDKSVVIPEGIARVHVTMASQNAQKAPVHVFNASGTYLNLSGKTDAAGIKEFRLPAASYKFRADYLGTHYWATAGISRDVINTVELNIGDGQFSLTVSTGAGPLTGVKIYAFKQSGSYTNMNANSNGNGQISFKLPNGSYKFRADYLGYRFWSDVHTVPSSLSGTLLMPHMDVMITVEGIYRGSQPLAGLNVHLFTSQGGPPGRA